MDTHKKMHLRLQGKSDAQVEEFYCYCDICGKKLWGRTALQWHKKKVHSTVPVPCPTCGKTFATGYKLNYHRDREHRPKLCKHCDYKSANDCDLKRHMARHFDPQFQCSYCEKRLKSERSLAAHERGHTGEAPFKCDVCGNSYKSQNVLLTHKQGVHKIFGPNAKQGPPAKRIRKKTN